MKKTTIFITHHPDEAVRIGDRIAIMRDGKRVQTGMAEQTVMHPADDQVADFAVGISRRKVVRAHAVMQGLGGFVQAHCLLPFGAKQVGKGETLSTLINLVIDCEGPIVVQDQGRAVGVIPRADILRTVV